MGMKRKMAEVKISGNEASFILTESNRSSGVSVVSAGTMKDA